MKHSFFWITVSLLAAWSCAEIQVDLRKDSDGGPSKGQDTSDQQHNDSDTISPQDTHSDTTDTEPGTGTDPITCSDDPCSPNATCIDTDDGYICECQPGWTDTGTECEPDADNDCANGEHTCDINATCTYTGSHTFDCDCNEGWQGDGQTCADLNECDAGTDNCDEDHGTCSNTPGSFGCGCEEDWHIDSADNITCLCDPGITCDDNNLCTNNDICDADGVCAGEPKEGVLESSGGCDDEDACTEDACNSQDGECSHLPTICDDSNACTDNSCNPTTGCVFVKNSAPCDDGNPCTTTDSCSEGVCVGTGDVVCNDGNPCTDGSCNTANGQCEFTNNTVSCDDSNPCTTSDTCSVGTCTGTPPPGCDDSNACTENNANPTTCDCEYPAIVCDDSSVCTSNECDTVTGCYYPDNTATMCDDSNPCTDNNCDPTGGCANPTNAASCDDDDACTASDVCSAGGCSSGPAHSICATCSNYQHCVDTGSCTCQPCADAQHCGTNCTACEAPTPMCKDNGDDTSTCVECLVTGDCPGGECVGNVCNCQVIAHDSANDKSCHDGENSPCDDTNSDDGDVKFLHTLSTGVGNSRHVVVGVAFEGRSSYSFHDEEIDVSVTYNAVPMTPVINRSATDKLDEKGERSEVASYYFSYVSLWYIQDAQLPTSAGSHYVEVLTSAAPYSNRKVSVGVSSYTGVSQGAPYDWCSNKNTSSSIACAVDADPTNTCDSGKSWLFSVVASDDVEDNFSHTPTDAVKTWFETEDIDSAGGHMKGSGTSISDTWDWIESSYSDHLVMISASWPPA